MTSGRTWLLFLTVYGQCIWYYGSSLGHGVTVSSFAVLPVSTWVDSTLKPIVLQGFPVPELCWIKSIVSTVRFLSYFCWTGTLIRILAITLHTLLVWCCGINMIIWIIDIILNSIWCCFHPQFVLLLNFLTKKKNTKKRSLIFHQQKKGLCYDSSSSFLNLFQAKIKES